MVHFRIEAYSQGEEEVSLNWVRGIGKMVLQGEGWRGEGTLSIVLVDDESIQGLNRRFLQQNRVTDVLAFSLGDEDEKGVWGEVYISKDRTREQALIYRVSFEEEMARLIVHGILHLVGYDDIDERSKKKMREREDHYLARIMHNVR